MIFIAWKVNWKKKVFQLTCESLTTNDLITVEKCCATWHCVTPELGVYLGKLEHLLILLI